MKYILLTTMTPNGAEPKVHYLSNLFFRMNPKTPSLSPSLTATVISYFSISSDLLMWEQEYTIPWTLEVSGEVDSVTDSVYEYLVSTSGPLPGGILLDSPTPLEEAKAYLWDKVKTTRDAKAYGGALTDFGVVDTTPESLTLMNGAASSASLAMAASQPWSITWTFQSNMGITLNPTQFIGVSLQVAAHIDACHSRGRELRSLIENATSELELLEVNYLEGWPDLTPEE